MPRPSLADSPWFWTMLFSCVGLIALQLMGWKYDARQASLERQFQGREWARRHGAQVQMNPQPPRTMPVPVVASAAPVGANRDASRQPPVSEATANDSPSGEEPLNGADATAQNALRFSQPGSLLISLRPLKWLAWVGLIVSCAALWRKTRHVQRVLEQP